MENKMAGELIAELSRTQAQLVRASKLMLYKHKDDSEMYLHARELEGAAQMINSWIDGIIEEAIAPNEEEIAPNE